MEIVTGSTGEVHVTPIDDAVRNSNVSSLSQRVVFTYLQNFAATIVTNNEVRIGSGYGSNQGRIFKIDKDEFDSVTIENGSQGYKRADIIVARYTMNTQTGFEDISLQVVRGTSGNTYTDPSYSTGNINQGATQDDMPLYRVKLNGLLIEAVERMFTLVPDGGRLGQLESIVNAHQTAFNALNFRTNLASESTVYPKNGADVRPGVEGVLPAAHGGTGQTSLKNAANSLIGGIDTNGANPTDSEQYIGTSSGVTGYQKKPLSSLWNYIRGKIEILLGMTTTDILPINHGGTGKTSIGAKKVLVGNAQGTAFEEWIIDDAPNSANADHFVTSKGIADAMGDAGYGDMMKATYDPNRDGKIDVTQGGTGASNAADARTNLGAASVTQLTDGSVTRVGTSSKGSANQPIYLSNGLPAVGNTFVPSTGGTFTGRVDVNGNDGTASAVGSSQIMLGNNTPTGSSQNSMGVLSLYSSGSNYVNLCAQRGNGNTSIYLPAGRSNEILATTAQLDDYMPKSGGTFTGNVALFKGGNTVTLVLGNNKETASPGNAGSTGELRVYNDYTYYANLLANDDMGGSRTIILPKYTGVLALDTSSSRRVKENICNMTEERAKKILDLDIVNFDYIGEYGGGLKDQSGVIAEEAVEIIPEAVEIASNYDETKPIDEKTNPAPSVDYRKFVPYLIKMVQMQQKEIEELKAALK